MATVRPQSECVTTLTFPLTTKPALGSIIRILRLNRSKSLLTIMKVPFATCSFRIHAARAERLVPTVGPLRMVLTGATTTESSAFLFFPFHMVELKIGNNLVGWGVGVEKQVS